MTSKGAPDTAVLERRFRPIYEWLDAGNNKKALQLCDKVLKKSPQLQCARAFRALTLLRMGRTDTTQTILKELATERPIDDTTLQAMSMCYKELNKLEEICRLYSNAVQLDAQNEELHTHLFMSYARIFDFKAQHQSAMVLYRCKPKTPYYCWAVMALVLQATRGDGVSDNHKRSLLLQLAERMMRKIYDENKMESEQELHLYRFVLELQQRYQEALRLIDSPMATSILANDKGAPTQTRLHYLAQLRRWRRLNAVCRACLLDPQHVERWEVWQYYVESSIQLAGLGVVKGNTESSSGKEEDEEAESEPITQDNIPNGNMQEDTNGDIPNIIDDSGVHDDPSKCDRFITRVIQHHRHKAKSNDSVPASDPCRNNSTLRSAHLARFELCKHLREWKQRHASDGNVEVDAMLEQMPSLFSDYFVQFGHKPCCVNDLRNYLHLMEEAQRFHFCETTLQHQSIAEDVPHIQRHLGAQQLMRLCGAHARAAKNHPGDNGVSEWSTTLTTTLWLHYQHGYEYHRQRLLLTDLGPSDNYALLCAHTLYDMAIQCSVNNNSTRTDEATTVSIGGHVYLLAAIVVLEYLLKHSPSNYHAKLLLIQFYHIVGGALGAHQWYGSLDAKYLQLDSLGYIHCARLPCTGLLWLCGNLFDTTLKFFSSHYKESTDYLSLAYRFGSFLKLDEFMDFRERLNHSLHYANVSVDRTMLTLLECQSIENLLSGADMGQSLKESIDWAFLRDNGDYSVYQCWDPEYVSGGGPMQNNPFVTEVFFRQNVEFLRLRTSMLRALVAAIRLVRTHHQQQQCDAEQVTGALDIWRGLLHDNPYLAAGSKYLKRLSRQQCTMPLPSRLHQWLEACVFEIVGEWLRVIVMLQKISVCSEDAEALRLHLEKIHRHVDTLLDRMRRKCEQHIHMTIHRKLEANSNKTVNNGQDNNVDLVGKLDHLSLDEKNQGTPLVNQSEDTNLGLGGREAMELTVVTIEVVSLASLAAALCAELLVPPKKRNNKRQQHQQQHHTSLSVQDIVGGAVNHMRNALIELNSVLEQWGDAMDELYGREIEQLQVVLTGLTLQLHEDERQDEQLVLKSVKEYMVNSFKFSCKDLQNVLRTKVKLLNGYGWLTTANDCR